MKKILLAISAGVFASIAQAAAISWGGGISLPDGETAISANTVAYLVYSSSAFTDTGSLKFDGTDLVAGSSAVASAVSSYTITADDAAGWSFMSVYDKSGASADGYYAILIGNSASDPTSYSFYGLEAVTGTTPQSSALDRVTGHNWDSDYLTQNGWTVAASAVPEPTSGLLMLVGIAGLALRRRRA